MVYSPRNNWDPGGNDYGPGAYHTPRAAQETNPCPPGQQQDSMGNCAQNAYDPIGPNDPGHDPIGHNDPPAGGGIKTPGSGGAGGYDQNGNLGGIYGAQQYLMSGKRTPMEDSAGYGWLQMATQGPNRSDRANEQGYRSLANNASPGEAGAFKAYSGMIGSGYSPQEKAAMYNEGAHAVLGQKDSTLRGMQNLAQRTGNTSGMFGAAAKVGSNAADQLGQFGRQNVINNANETERRTEAGAAGLTGVGAQSNQRIMGALNGSNNLSNQMNQRTQAGLTGLGGWNAAGRANELAGLNTGVGLWNSTNAQQLSYYNLLAQLLRTPTGSHTGTTGLGLNGSGLTTP